MNAMNISTYSDPRGLAQKFADRQDGEAEGFSVHDSETRDGSGEGEGISSELLVPQAQSANEGPDPFTQEDAGEAEEGTGDFGDAVTAGVIGEEGNSASSTDDSGDKSERPQLTRDPELPEGFDYRDLKLRRYGKILPPLTDLERQNLKASIISRGFLGRILIDEWLNVIDGNSLCEICLETGIIPVVEILSGLSEEEKEDLALSCNLDRRQLKDPEVERQVFEARLDNLLELRRKHPKKYPLKSIAEKLGVSLATVSLRERERHTSEGETVSKPDARRRYDENIEREAVRLVKEGMPQADVARTLLMNPKAVQRAVKKNKKRESGGGTATRGKRENASTDSTAQPTQPIEDITANDGIPRVHRLALEHIGQDDQAYVEWLKAASAKASEAVDAAADSAEELLKLFLYGSQVAAAANLRLGQLLNTPSENADEETPPGDFYSDSSGCKAGDILQGSVMAIEPDEVFVALPLGVTGVIDNRGNSLTWKEPLEQGKVVRVGVEGIDSDRGLVNIKLLGRQSVSKADCANAFGPRLDDRRSPDMELAGLKAGPKEKEVL